MQASKLNRLKKNIFVGVFIIMIISLTSCSQKYTFLTSPVVPGAKGHATVRKDKNKNYTIELRINDLAKVERVNSLKSTYVVWMATDEGNVENLGQLQSSTSFLSKRHNASLQTASSYKPVKIFITTENGINVQYPGEQTVLTTGDIKVR